MTISELQPKSDFTLLVKNGLGQSGVFDVKPYLDYEVFAPLREINEFMKVSNGGYFVEWDCGADLSADTIAAQVFEEPGCRPSVAAESAAEYDTGGNL